MKLWSTASTSSLYLATLPNQLLLRFEAIDCEFKAEGSGNACVYMEGNTGTGGNGFVYWPSFINCDFHGPGAGAGSSAIIRTGSTGNGVLFTKVVGGRMTGAARHLDLQKSLNGRYAAISHDDCFTGSGNGRFIYLGSAANANVFSGAHFEESGIEKAVEFTAGCDQNYVEAGTPIDFSHVIGLGLGVANKTSGFSQFAGSDSNPNPDPTTFELLLQNEIREKTAAAGVTIDGALLKDGALWGPVHSTAGVAAFVPGASYQSVMRPDGAGLQMVFLDGIVRNYARFEFDNGPGNSRGMILEPGTKVTTTGSVLTSLQTISITDNSVVSVVFTINAYRTGGARGTGAVGDVAKFERRVTVKRVSGAVTILATETVGTDYRDADLIAAGTLVSFTTGVGTLITQCNGGAANLTLVWQSVAQLEAPTSL
jgi:hypothetical protein